jgi:CheY-like chemotaxis protein
VLYAEDHDITRKALGYILEQAGFEVTAASDGLVALDQLKRGQFDVMLLDLHMPSMDGYKVLESMNRMPAERIVPVVVLSDNSDRESVSRCVALRVKRFLVKRTLIVDRLCDFLRECAQNTEGQSAAEPAPAPGVKPAVAAAAAAAPAAAAAATAPAATPADNAPEVRLDQQEWKEKLQELGRVTRDQATGMLQLVALPLMFPDILDQVRGSMGGDMTAIDDLVSNIEQEPRLLLELLGLANKNQETSAAAVHTDVALRWVGNAGVRTIIDLVVASGTKPVDEAIAPWVTRWWMHSVAVAQIAGRLAPLLNVEPPQAIVAGMLHDIGRLALLCSDLGPKVATCYDLSRNMAVGTNFAEQSLLGVNHIQAARILGERMKIPAQVMEVCETHDIDDSRRQALEQGSARMSALICAADQFAKIAGLGSLANDELLPIPEMVSALGDRVLSECEAALAEIQTILTWRLAGRQAAPAADLIRLDGMVLGMVSNRVMTLNTYQRQLSRAGARCVVYKDVAELLSSQHTLDLLLIDQTREGIMSILPALRRIAQHPSLGSTPRLLMARRSDDPEQVLTQAGVKVHVYATPIRAASLLQVVRRLTRG